MSAALDAQQLVLAAILVTHHNADHVGGVDPLRERLPAPVYWRKRERIPEPCVALRDRNSTGVPGLRFEVTDLPGDTSRRIAYFDAADTAEPILSCGDTLCASGCDPLFEGTPAQLRPSRSRLAALPGDTRVCCSDEYTLSNPKVARTVEPNNPDLTEYVDGRDAQRKRGRATLPSSIARERLVNPFLHGGQSTVAHRAREHGANCDDPDAAPAALRQWKNNFR